MDTSHKQLLNWIYSLQKELGAYLWLDSGTLLGIVRESNFLNWDKDIDLGMWSDDIDKLYALTSNTHICSNCELSFKYFKKEIYHVSIKDRSLKFPVHINVYQRNNNYAYCAQGHSLVSEKRGVSRIIGKAVHRVFQSFSKDRYVWSAFWPMKKYYDVYTWVIPAYFFLEFTRIPILDKELVVPKQYAEYLTARYGDWGTPKQNWKYWIDDKCIILHSPDKVFLDMV